MTAYPIEENAGYWWLTTSARYDRLHAVPETALIREDMQEALANCSTVDRPAACGPTPLTLMYPGLFSRHSLPRCAHCCRALGIPEGDGTPSNENATTTNSGNQ